MCLLEIILAKLYDGDDKPFVTESGNVSRERCTNEERNGVVSIPKTSEEANEPKQKDMNGNNKSMDPVGGILGIAVINMLSSAAAESSEYSGLKTKPDKPENKWPNWNERPSESSSHNWNKQPSESSSYNWNKAPDTWPKWNKQGNL